MGQEISTVEFTTDDEKIFHQKLREETKILKRWFDQKLFDDSSPKCGLELEAWLVTKDFIPSPQSNTYIDKLADPMVVPEISKFNFELNSEPYELIPNLFSALDDELSKRWKKCEQFAEDMGLRALTIGTLPTLRDYMLSMEYLSPQMRYFALNKRVMDLRDNKPIKIEIEGKDRVELVNENVITECAATSLQIHYGVSLDNAAEFYNASLLASPFIVAVAANSPFFYGKELWDETRIPIFERSVNMKSYRSLDGDDVTRVSMGSGFVRHSILELFIENLDGHPILLPEHNQNSPEWLDHLRLHNGTIWRWNRPLIGLSKNAKPSLRLEFRVPSAGPTIKDTMANVVFQIALVEYFASIENLSEKISFEKVKNNFYCACKESLDAKITWIDGKVYYIQELIVQIFPQLKEALKKKGISNQEIEYYLNDIILQRVKKKQNGANWQKAYIHTYGSRFQEMLESYYEYQKENKPVHLWSI